MKFNLPPELDDMPLNLLRSQLYPRYPDKAVEGVQAYFDGHVGVEMPGRMGIGDNPASAASLIDALEQEHLRRKQFGGAVGTSAPQEPVYAAIEAGGLNHLPQLSDNESPDLYTVPVARGVSMQTSLPMQAPELNALSDDLNDVTQAAGQVADKRRRDALQSVQQQINALRSLVFGG